MTTIKDVVGAKNYERMKKRGIASPQRLRELNPDQVMELARIGPKTAQKLYRFLGKPVKEKVLESKYRKLKIRSRFKKIRMYLDRLAENPEPTIARLEELRRKGYALQNVIAAAQNVGRAEHEKIRMEHYEPVPLNIGLESFREETEPRYLLQYTVSYKGRNFLVEEQRINTARNQEVGSSSELIKGNVMGPEQANEALEIFADSYNKFREYWPEGTAAVILDINDPGLLQELFTKKYSADIKDNKLYLVTGNKRFMEWEVLLKYKSNLQFIEMVARVDQFLTFYDYRQAQLRGETETFEAFKDTTSNTWEKLTNEASDPRANIRINTGYKLALFFGVIESIDGMYQYQEKDYRKEDFQAPSIRSAEDFETFKRIRQEKPSIVQDLTVPPDVAAMVTYVLSDDYIAQYSKTRKTLVVVSRTLPDIGFVIR